MTRALLHVQASVVYNWDQQKDFKNFLVNQLTDLMEGLTNPAVIQESERVRALHKKYNEPYMRRPRYGWQCMRDLQDLCRLGILLCLLAVITEQRQKLYCMKPKTCADNLHAFNSYELHSRVVALRPITLCSSVLAIPYDMGPATNQCLSSRGHFLQIVSSKFGLEDHLISGAKS